MPLRYVAEEREISEITESDKRVRVVGIVVDVGDDCVVVDDGTGKVEVALPNFEGKIGDTVKIIGRVFSLNGKVTINCECYELLRGFDVKLYKEARKIVKKVMEYV